MYLYICTYIFMNIFYSDLINRLFLSSDRLYWIENIYYLDKTYIFIIHIFYFKHKPLKM